MRNKMSLAVEAKKRPKVGRNRMKTLHKCNETALFFAH